MECHRVGFSSTIVMAVGGLSVSLKHLGLSEIPGKVSFSVSDTLFFKNSKTNPYYFLDDFSCPGSDSNFNSRRWNWPRNISISYEDF